MGDLNEEATTYLNQEIVEDGFRFKILPTRRNGMLEIYDTEAEEVVKRVKSITAAARIIYKLKVALGEV